MSGAWLYVQKLVGEVFNIVSQQSTARPGCIIELDVITNQVGSKSVCVHMQVCLINVYNISCMFVSCSVAQTHSCSTYSRRILF